MSSVRTGSCLSVVWLSDVDGDDGGFGGAAVAADAVRVGRMAFRQPGACYG